MGQNDRANDYRDGQRAITGTWVTDEVKMAMKKGYILDTMLEVWHYNNIQQYDPQSKSCSIFTVYINTFLKMKQEASGWSAWVKTENDIRRYILMTTLRKKESNWNDKIDVK